MKEKREKFKDLHWESFIVPNGRISIIKSKSLIPLVGLPHMVQTTEPGPATEPSCVTYISEVATF